MRQVEDHVCRALTSLVPTISMFLSSLFQEHVSNFGINVLLFQNATITEQNIRVNILELGDLTKPKDLIMCKTILNIV